jgi:hypothetical protein
VFFTNPVPQLLPMNNQLQMNGVPRLPQCFVGREACMYNVISALRSADILRVGGIIGVGKSCLISAVCGYIMQRPRSFPMDYLFWLEPSSSSPPSKGATQNSPYQELTSAFQAVFEDASLTDNAEYSMNLARLSTLLDQKRIYLVFNRCKLEIATCAQNMETFIHDLMTIASVKSMKIILLSSMKYEAVSLRSSSHGRHEATVKISSLDLESAAMVLSSHLPMSLMNRYPDLCLSSPIAMARHLIPPESVRNLPSFQEDYKELWKRLGKGIPSRIRDNARNMTYNEMLTIINWWRMRPT